MKQCFGFAVRCSSLSVANEDELGQYLAVFCAKSSVPPEAMVVLQEASPEIQKKAIQKAKSLLLGGLIRPFLTPRENQVLEKVKLGWTNKAIGDSLNISARTVKHHVAGLFKKFNVKQRFDLTPL